MSPTYSRNRVRPQSTGVFTVWWAPYLVSQLYELLRGNGEASYSGAPDPLSKAIDDLAAVGGHLLDHPQPPWIIGPADPWPSILAAQPARHVASAQLNPVAYLGAAAVTLILIESLTEIVKPENNPQLGPLNNLYPYIAQRWGIGPVAELPDLPVPEMFQPTFRGWALGKINFVQSGPGIPSPQN